MRKRRIYNNSRSIIPPTRAISLYEGPWKCLASEGWSEQHHVFFGEKSCFFNFTMGRDMRSGGSHQCHHVADWVIESEPGRLVGCMRLQMISGDFKAGYLLFHMASADCPASRALLSQFLTSLFILQKLDTLMIVPTDIASGEMTAGATGERSKTIMSFAKGLTTDPVKLTPVLLERDVWLSSEIGESSLNHLTWLKKRVERERRITTPEIKPRKLSWLSSILSLGLRRPLPAPTVHPLDSFRRQN